MSQICLKKKYEAPIVYLTNTGHCYHEEGCYGAYIDVELEIALKLNKRACSVCDPPRREILLKLSGNNNRNNDYNQLESNPFSSLSTRNISMLPSNSDFSVNNDNNSNNSNSNISISYFESLLDNNNNNNFNNYSAINNNVFMKNFVDLMRNFDSKLNTISNENNILKEKNNELNNKVKELDEKINQEKAINLEQNLKISNLTEKIRSMEHDKQNIENSSILMERNLLSCNEKIDKIERVIKLQFEIHKQNKEKINSLKYNLENLSEKLLENLAGKIGDNLERKFSEYDNALEKIKFLEKKSEKFENELIQKENFIEFLNKSQQNILNKDDCGKFLLNKNIISKFALRKLIKENKKKSIKISININNTYDKKSLMNSINSDNETNCESIRESLRFI